MKKARKMMTRLVLTSLRRVKYVVAICGIAILLLSSCYTFPTAITISLAPQVILPTINLGAGSKVYLSVVDDRPNNLAAEFSAPHHPTIAIRDLFTSEPIAVLLEKNVGQGLKNMGFELIPALSASETRLTINVLSFYVVSRPGLDNWTGDLSIKVQLYKNEGQVIDKEYSGIKDFSNPFPPYASIESLMTANINPIVSDLILKIIGDLELIAALQSTEG